MGLRLNLGCGAKRIEGFINVDKCGDPDVTHDLENFPWPWEESSASQILLNHVLEHLGRDPDVFQHWYRLHPERPANLELLLQESALFNNLIEQIEMDLRIVK